ncbi:R3H domain-containing protein 1 [Kryptolebias marmoratus]|uniref:R3H domain-containing protein 1 n=1 Tax=Kryptolebias marmoratus TaxID=37003 RepID=UPI0018ACC11C|nr:R3H domain-containing protein 1 [Kryptolebias marmoratus]
MRMSDITDTEAMKVSEAVDAASNDNAARAEDRGGGGVKDAQPAKHSKSNTRLKLVRSLAVCEESFPCAVLEPSAAPQDGFLPPALDGEERGAKDQAEKEGGCDKADRPDKAPRKTLSRDSSQDYTDSTGIDLHEFLVNTLKGNPRDRIMLLKLEQDILDFISNNESQKRKFPPMTSYHRMLLHRVAAYFGMDHNVDPSGKSVVINKTVNTRIPDQKFLEHIKDERVDDFQKRYILKRDNSSFDRDDGTIRMRLKADKRSKSMEEREEEYQRARERIFAHDGDHFMFDKSAQEERPSPNTQQRRQMFRLRAGHLGASRHSSSETEAPPRHGEPRPWSSTDSSDSSNRLAARPAITKASSFNGLVRGDSTASSKSTGRLSKTGSESCSSVGSSSSSLSRPQLPLPASASLRPSTPSIHHAATARGHFDAVKSVPASDAAGYYMLPLEASGIPPGSVLIHPHTGKPFVHPDGSAVLYNPAAGRFPQRGKTPPQPIPTAPQQQAANHLHSQPVCPPLQPSSEPVYNPTLSYPLPPQYLPVCPPNQQCTVPEVLSAQFGHMTLQPAPGESAALVPDARYPSAYAHHPPPVVLQGPPPAQPQQVTGYVVGAHPGLHVPYPGSPAGPSVAAAAFPALLQQHAYVQQQMPACYCSSAHHPQCSTQQQHQYRPPVSQLTYNCPQSQNLPQQQVHQAVIPNPASSYQTVVGVQPTPNLALTGNQQSNMASQMQGMMVQCPPMPSYQQVSVPQQTYQQPVFVSCQPGQGPVAVSGVQPCYGLLPPAQHTTMSSTVSFLPAPMMEPLQFPQTSSPCVSQQHPGQQYAGTTASPVMKSSSRELTPPLSSGVSPRRPQLPTAFCHSGQGEAPYSLLGQPLQYKPSVRPPLIHAAHVKHQGPLGVWRQGRKPGRKPLSSDLS